jgi:septal ring factor EnvC (AmiA/AmiB activator)
MSITEAVLQSSAHHAQLLAQIAELDYVPPALKQQEMYIAALEKDLDALAPQIAELEKTTKKERKEHEALRDSTMRRLAAKITGREEKFAEKASKEER